jgi:hypothetical protein
VAVTHAGDRDASSFGDWLPDEFGDVDHEIGAFTVRTGRRANLAHAHADDVIESAVSIAVAEVKDAAHYLPSPGRVGAAISVPLEHDCRAVIGFDHRAEVGTERPRLGAALREVSAPEASRDVAPAATIGEKQMLLPPALEPDRPALRVGKSKPI